MAKHWSVRAQTRYMYLVEKNNNHIQREMGRKLRSDAALDGCITSGQFFLIEDVIGEAYRAGAIDALMEEK